MFGKYISVWISDTWLWRTKSVLCCVLSPFIIVLCNCASRQDINYNNISKFLTLNSCLYWAHGQYFESSVLPNIWTREQVEPTMLIRWIFLPLLVHGVLSVLSAEVSDQKTSAELLLEALGKYLEFQHLLRRVVDIHLCRRRQQWGWLTAGATLLQLCGQQRENLRDSWTVLLDISPVVNKGTDQSVLLLGFFYVGLFSHKT